MKEFLAHLFDIRPKDDKDYCTFFFWQVSRKLAIVLVIFIIVCCVCLLWCLKPAKFFQKDITYRTYRYNALPLKFVTGKVKILGKSGYTAYIGDVENGMIKGKGTLYNPQGNVVYEGDFDANAYNGTGKYYGQNAQPMYEGMFQDNLYNGAGKLYRSDGTLWYEGNFEKGSMEGEGILYNTTQDKIYQGFFQEDAIFYQGFLGKSAAEATEIYLGKREVYTGEQISCVHMKEIDAVYFGTDRRDALEEMFQISGLYILKPQICLEGKTLNQISQITQVLGTPVYQGNTYLSPEDEVALNLCCDVLGDTVLYGKSNFQRNKIFADVTEVSDFQKNYQAYIYVYDKDGILYTFFCKDKDSGFDFYRMEE